MKRLSIKTNQSGMASIVVVGVMVVLLTLITVGFSLIMNRALNNALNNQQAAAASYAAQSGINDVVNHIKAETKVNPNFDPSSSSCDGYTKTGTDHDISSQLNISGDASTAVTCVLVDQSPTDLVYQPVQTNYSQVVNLNNASAINQIFIGWRSADGKTLSAPYQGDPNKLPDQTVWSNIPLIRLTIFPVTAGPQDPTQNPSHTYFLTPTQTAAPFTSKPFNTADGSIIPVDCGNINAPAPFAGDTQGYDCNMVFTGLPAGYYVLRITSLYDQAGVKIEASDSHTHKKIQFNGVQTLIDVTAKSSSAVKRLQERVDADTSGIDVDNASAQTLPEQALRSADAVCKRLNVTGAGFTLDPGTSPSDCNGPPSPAPIVLTLSPPNQAYPNVTLPGNVDPRGTTLSCYFQFGLAIANNAIKSPDQTNCSSVIFSTKQNVSSTFSVTNAAYKNKYKTIGTTVYYQAFASNGTVGKGSIQSFAVSPLAPTVVTGNAKINNATSATLQGQVNPNGSTLNGYSNNYGATTKAKATSGCFFVLWDEKTPGTLIYQNCGQNLGAASSLKPVNGTVNKLIQGDRYWYYLCASNAKINAQNLPYGSTVCDKNASLFVPRPLPVIATGGVNSGAMIKSGKNGSTLPQAAYQGSLQTNGWSVSLCRFYWDNDSDPLQGGQTPACDQPIAQLNAGAPGTKQAITATTNLSAYKNWNNVWFFYTDQAVAHEIENTNVTWSGYGAEWCFQAGVANTNMAYQSNTNGNCGQVIDTGGGGDGGGSASCDVPSPVTMNTPFIDSSNGHDDVNISVGGHCTDGSTKTGFNYTCTTFFTSRGARLTEPTLSDSATGNGGAGTACFYQDEVFNGDSNHHELSGYIWFIDNSGAAGPSAPKFDWSWDD